MNRTFCLAHMASGRDDRNVLWAKRLYWVLDIDIRKYFDSIPHSHLHAFLDQRASDGMDSSSTPTRCASSTSAHIDDRARAIPKRMEPASTSLA
jgi:hypothetical protein